MRRIALHLLTVLATAVVAAGILTVANTSPAAEADTNASSFAPISPTRVFNTRDQPRPAGGTQMTVQTGVTGATAVAVNVTVTDVEDWGFLTAWPSGSRPDTSVINADGPGRTIANGLIIPVTPQGTFEIWTSTGMHVLVDLMGSFRPASGGGSTPPSGSTGVTAQITGYSPLFNITEVSGTATNGSSSTKSFRIDVDCPGDTTETWTLFNVPAGATRGWSVLCDGVFTAGATIARIVDV